MLDPFDYKEPACPLCDGKEFYYPDRDAPLGTIPVGRIIARVDACFDRGDLAEAGRLLNAWQKEALALRDRRGELSIVDELIGYYRKTGEKEEALAAVSRALELLEQLSQGDTVSGATILLNCATTKKAFGEAATAMPLYRRAEAIYLAQLEESDPRFGGLYNNMALALCDLSDFEGAERAYLRALAVMGKAAHGEGECAITQVNLAHLYEASGDFRKIRPALDEAYTLLQTEDLPRDGHYAFICEKCAPSFAYFGEEERAEILSKRAGEIYERA